MTSTNESNGSLRELYATHLRGEIPFVDIVVASERAIASHEGRVFSDEAETKLRAEFKSDPGVAESGLGVGEGCTHTNKMLVHDLTDGVGIKCKDCGARVIDGAWVAERVIARGQWLAMENKVGSLEWKKRGGWVMTDSTGATYPQSKFPDGLKTWDAPTDGRTETEPTPWPAPPSPTTTPPNPIPDQVLIPLSAQANEEKRRAYWRFMESVVWGGTDSEHWCRECGGRYPLHKTTDCKALRWERATAEYVEAVEAAIKRPLEEEIARLRAALGEVK